MDAPVTLNVIENYAQVAESIVQACSPHVKNLMILRDNQRQLIEAVRRDQEAMLLIDELARLIESGVEQRTSELAKQHEIIAAYSSLSAGMDEAILGLISEEDGDFTVDEYRESAINARKHAEGILLKAKREYDDFVKLRDRSLSLAQELRAIAARILEERPSDECPLCHTKFQPGELVCHMAAGVDQRIEVKAQELLENVHCADAAVTSAGITEKAANQISSLCARMKLPQEAVLTVVLTSLNEARIAQTEARMRMEELESEISAMETDGLSIMRLNEVSASINALGFNFADRSQLMVSSLRSEVQQRLSVTRKQMEVIAQEYGQLREFVNQAASVIRPSEADPVAAIAEINERLVATRAIYTALKRFLPHFRWEGARPIVEWKLAAAAVSGIASQLQTALEKERIAAKIQSDASRRRDVLQRQENALVGRVNRLDEAQKAFIEIQTKHSLRSMTDSALQSNRKSIENIFAQIHSPAEFKAIGADWTLIRKYDDTKMSIFALFPPSDFHPLSPTRC